MFVFSLVKQQVDFDLINIFVSLKFSIFFILSKQKEIRRVLKSRFSEIYSKMANTQVKQKFGIFKPFNFIIFEEDQSRKMLNAGDKDGKQVQGKEQSYYYRLRQSIVNINQNAQIVRQETSRGQTYDSGQTPQFLSVGNITERSGDERERRISFATFEAHNQQDGIKQRRQKQLMKEIEQMRILKQNNERILKNKILSLEEKIKMGSSYVSNEQNKKYEETVRELQQEIKALKDEVSRGKINELKIKQLENINGILREENKGKKYEERIKGLQKQNAILKEEAKGKKFEGIIKQYQKETTMLREENKAMKEQLRGVIELRGDIDAEIVNYQNKVKSLQQEITRERKFLDSFKVQTVSKYEGILKEKNQKILEMEKNHSNFKEGQDKQFGLKALQVKNITENYQALKVEYADINQKYSEKISQVKLVKTQLIKKDEALKKLQITNQELKNQINDFKKQFFGTQESTAKEIQFLEKQRGGLEENLRSSKKIIETTEEQNHQLQRQIQRLKNLLDKAASVEKNHLHEIQYQKVQIQKLEGDNGKGQTNLQSMKKQLEDLNKQVTEITLQKFHLKAQISKVQEDFYNLKDKLKEKQDMMEIVKKTSADMMESLVNQIQVLEKSNSQLRESMIALSSCGDQQNDFPEAKQAQSRVMSRSEVHKICRKDTGDTDEKKIVLGNNKLKKVNSLSQSNSNGSGARHLTVNYNPQ